MSDCKIWYYFDFVFYFGDIYQVLKYLLIEGLLKFRPNQTSVLFGTQSILCRCIPAHTNTYTNFTLG
jgi:hypothetical protein